MKAYFNTIVPVRLPNAVSSKEVSGLSLIVFHREEGLYRARIGDIQGVTALLAKINAYRGTIPYREVERLTRLSHDQYFSILMQSFPASMNYGGKVEQEVPMPRAS